MNTHSRQGKHLKVYKVEPSSLRIARKRRHSNLVGEKVLDLNLPVISTFNFTEDVELPKKEEALKSDRSRRLGTSQHQVLTKLGRSIVIKPNRPLMKMCKLQIYSLHSGLHRQIKGQEGSVDQSIKQKHSVQMVGQFKWSKGDMAQKRYEFLDVLGMGTFGTVFQGFDHVKKEGVAIKVIRNEPQCNQMAQTEINLLVMIREKDPKDERSIMRVKDFFTFRNHICIVSELLSINLFEMLRKTQFKGMHIEIVRKITIQLMTALAFLKGLKIIHGDIKPENIVLKEFNKTGIKLIDFGTSIFKTDKHYDYLMSRYYRAPEVILGSPYDEKIDMWSAGCVLAEIYTGKPLFPGENEQQQIVLFVETIGMPNEDLLKTSSRKHYYFTPQNTVNPQIFGSIGSTVESLSAPLAGIVNDVGFCTFLKKLLAWSPRNRLSPEEALLDPWLLQGFPLELLPQHMKNVKKLKQALQQTVKTRSYMRGHRRTSSDNIN